MRSLFNEVSDLRHTVASKLFKGDKNEQFNSIDLNFSSNRDSGHPIKNLLVAAVVIRSAAPGENTLIRELKLYI